MKEVLTRMESNGKFFLANYIILTGLFTAFAVITSPMALIGIAIVFLVWMYVMKDKSSWSVGNRITLGGKSKTLIAGLIMVVIALSLGVLDAVLYGSAVGTTVTCIHMIAHKSVSSDIIANDIQINPNQPSHEELHPMLNGV